MNWDGLEAWRAEAIAEKQGCDAMFEVPWIVVTMDEYIDADLGVELRRRCEGLHGVTRHTLVGKRLHTEGAQMQCQLQFCCHRCARDALPGVDAEQFLDIITKANVRMGQGG